MVQNILIREQFGSTLVTRMVTDRLRVILSWILVFRNLVKAKIFLVNCLELKNFNFYQLTRVFFCF